MKRLTFIDGCLIILIVLFCVMLVIGAWAKSSL